MRVTFDQTEGSVLSLGGIPVGFSESLEIAEILRNSLISVFGVRLMFVVAVFNMPFSVLLVTQFSLDVSDNRSSDDISPFLDITLGGNLIELESTFNLEGVISHLIEETRGRRSIRADKLISTIKLKISLTSIKTFRVVIDVLRALIPVELLVLIINDEFLETASLLLAVQYERGRFVLRFLVVQVEAIVRLHGGEFRLSATSSPGKRVGNSVAVLNRDIEVDIRVKRNGLTSER